MEFISFSLDNISKIEPLIKINSIYTLEPMLKSYINFETGKSILFKTCLTYQLINNLLTVDSTTLWGDFDPINPYQYLFALKLRNVIYIKSFYYFMQGDILYDHNYRMQKAVLYRIFKNSTHKQSEVNGELSINSKFFSLYPNLKNDLLSYQDNLHQISRLVIDNELGTSFFPRKDPIFFQDHILIKNTAELVNTFI